MVDTVGVTSGVTESQTSSPDLVEQLKLEEEQVTLGSTRFMIEYNKAMSKGEMSSTSAGRRIVSGGVERVVEKLELWLQDQWVKQYKKKGRPLSIYPIIKGLDLNVAATIALRTVLDRVCNAGNSTYQRVAICIADRIQREMVWNELKAKHPHLFNWAVEKAHKWTIPARRASIMDMTADRKGIKVPEWTDEEKLRIGVVMIEMIRRATGIITIGPAPGHTGKDTTLNIYPHKSLMNWVKNHNAEASLMCPVYLPMVVPPLDWTNPHDGGYLNQHNDLTLVKTHKKAYLAELQVANPTAVYSAVNALQRTAWRVNERVLDVLQQVWKGRKSVAGLPPVEDGEEPAKPEDIETNHQARYVWRKEAAKYHRTVASHTSQRCRTMQIMGLAQRFKDRPIYFPYQLDFRGRVYPIPGGLNPQGDSLAKGLLQFNEGMPIATPEAGKWFLIHGANTYGIDKVSFDERIVWVEQHHEVIMAVGEDPLAYDFWQAADSPWQFLAWCMEYYQWKTDSVNFKSYIPIHLDASCSGLQHFSAMMRDEVGAKATNLLPSSTPQDIYNEVAKLTSTKLAALRGREDKPFAKAEHTIGQLSTMWLAYGIDRKICKRPVMTLPYGSTLFSCKQFIMEEVEEREVSKGVVHPFGDKLVEACSFLASIVWESIGEVVVSARQVMGWLQAAAKAATKSGLPVTWVSPSGLPVLQAYQDLKAKRVKLVLEGEITYFTLNKETPKLDRNRQRSGIAPNFVHSCDAAALVAAVNASVEAGITNVACIHDSFGTHAANTEKFSNLLRSTLVDMYSTHDVLAEFKAELERLGVEIPPLPVKGKMDLKSILNAHYSFA